MARFLVLASGFGAFERVGRNPSAAIVRRLAAEPPPGCDVRSVVLPVSFARAPAAWDAHLRAHARRAPDLLLALGVHRRPGFRLELRAKGRLFGRVRTDVDGRVGRESRFEDARELRTRVDVRALVRRLAARDVGTFRASERAGGYVCERVCHHVLLRAEGLGRPGLFVHVPPERFMHVDAQVAAVRALVSELAS